VQKDRPGEDTSGGGHRLSRHPEWIRNLLHHGRRADRRSLQCRQEGTTAGVVGDRHPPLCLVVDEVGYLAYGQDAANLLFHVLNDRHLRKRPMIFTINKLPSEWGKVLHDEDLAAAIPDRILERGRLIHLDGPSRQTRHLDLEKALSANADRARISDVLSDVGEYLACRPCNIDTAHPGQGNSQLAPYSILDTFLLGFTVAIDP
jgi:hypothetical protein